MRHNAGVALTVVLFVFGCAFACDSIKKDWDRGKTTTIPLSGPRFDIHCEHTGDFDSPEPTVTCAIDDKQTGLHYLWVRDMNVAGLAGGR